LALLVRRLVPEDHALLRDLRLRSLADSPMAFGSTYEAEEGLLERDWARRLDPDGYPHFAGFVDDVPVGMVAVGHDPAKPDVAYVLGMWVDPAARGTGAVDALITEALRCAAEQGRPSTTLHVTEGNVRAERAYERHGFRRTGTTYTRDRDGLQEIEMERPAD
jgi:ribosomal protein S18 acetylase RimI-like enzyme